MRKYTNDLQNVAGFIFESPGEYCKDSVEARKVSKYTIEFLHKYIAMLFKSVWQRRTLPLDDDKGGVELKT